MVIWSLPARDDLRAIHDYIAQSSPHYAKKTVQTIRERTDLLDELPRKGRKVPELNEDAVRELSQYSYRILYEIKPENLIGVLAVIHKRQDLKAGEIPRT